MSVLVEKEFKRTGQNGEEITKSMPYRLQFIDGARFIASSWSNLVNILSEGIHRTKCEYVHNDKKRESCRIEYIKLWVLSLTIKKFHEISKKRFANTFKFFKLILLLPKDVYPYEKMYDWKKT